MGWAKGANRNISNSNAQPPLYSNLKLSRFKMEIEPREGITESQAAACGEEMDSRCALSGKETLSSNTLKSRSSQFCQTEIFGASQHQDDPTLRHHLRRQVH